MSSDYSTPRTEEGQGGAGMGISDVYYILFRRKWLVMLGVVLGIGAAAAIWRLKQPLYESHAILLVRWVSDNRAIGPGADAQTVAVDYDSSSVIGAEVAILTSLDIAREVARIVGPDRILADKEGEKDEVAAAGRILKNLFTDVPPRTKIINLSFRHPDPGVAQEVLEKVVDVYLKKHDAIHSDIGMTGESLTNGMEQCKRDLKSTETALQFLKAGVQIGSLDEFRKSNSTLGAKLRQELFSAQADLAERLASEKEMTRGLTTNEVSASASSPAATVSPATAQDYRIVCRRVEELERQEQDQLTPGKGGLTPDAEAVKAIRRQLESDRKLKAMLEADNPGLLLVAAPGVVAPPGAGVDPIRQARVRVRESQDRVAVLQRQLTEVQQEALRVEQVEPQILELQQKRTSLETHLKFLEKCYQEQFDQAIGSGRTPNINRVQVPSPGTRDTSPLRKKLLMALCGGFAFGVGLAFLVEMVFDRTLKRVKDIEGILQLPIFLTIPALRLKRSTGSPAEAKGKRALAERGRKGRAETGAGVVPPQQEPASELKPFHDALRDRLVNYFEVRDMTHKPKLIAVTSCSEGAGVSTIATGLAASLSQTGDGNVLLVDMRGARSAVHAFYQGKPACGLEEALLNDSRNSALVHEHLYVVSASSPEHKLQRIIPRQFGDFVPKLKASDYDYIIFDMPPVEQTSITSKVSRFMDMVLVVLESDQTDRDVAKRATALLAESKANVATVLNKRRQYVPSWLQVDFH